MRGYLLLAAIAAVVLSLAGAGWWIYSEGKQAGIAKCQAERVEASNEAQKATDERDRTASEARTSMLDYLATQKPAIEIRTHETTERIRTVYKDRVVPSVCATSLKRPASVQADIDKARNRANSAASGLRLGTPANSTPGAGMAGNRPVGGNHDGPVRDSGNKAERYQPLPLWLAG